MTSLHTSLASDHTSAATQTAVSNSRLLALKIAFAQPRLDSAARAFWSAADLRERMPLFFHELFAIVRGGLQAMRMAARCADERSATGDAVAQALAPYLRRHIEEERDHEAWLLDDMEACGFRRELVQARLVRGPVAALIGAQMYWASQEHPVAFLGYLAAVEANPPTPAHLDAIRVATGFPPEAFRCMQEHAVADVAHAEELRNVIDSLPLAPRQSELLALSAFETIETLARIFEDLVHTPLRNEAL